MPSLEILNGASERDARPALTEHVRSATLANEQDADQLDERTAWAPPDAEQQSKEFPTHDDGATAAPPARSVRRATARRASNRRATARSRQSDTEASIIDFLAQHPGSTAGDVAKSLNLNPESVSNRLTQLAKTGEITKTSHGYITK
jgi:predicted Rossmann fold nucleotide-binding protein DprA/Smf involved in DNA uptake